MTVVLFIDTNQYLNLFRMVQGKKLLESLDEQKRHIFVSAQIVNEVRRRKLECAQLFFLDRLKDVDAIRTIVPDHLLGIDEDETKRIRAVFQAAEQAKAQLSAMAAQVLAQISRSEDDVSMRLKPLFDRAQEAGAEEMGRARERREKGNPPGKGDDPLGDQISWEQLLTDCKMRNVTRVWIITNDGDHCTKYEKKVLLNSFLYDDLEKACGKGVEIRCFSDLLAGMEDFGKNAGVIADKLPTQQEAIEIKKEIDSLQPVFGGPIGQHWVVTSGHHWFPADSMAMPAANMGILQQRRRGGVVEIQGWPYALMSAATAAHPSSANVTNISSGSIPTVDAPEPTKK